MNNSVRGELNTKDFKNLALLSLKAGVAYTLTHFVTNLSGVDLGENGEIIVMVATVAIDAIVKLLNGPKKEKNE